MLAAGFTPAAWCAIALLALVALLAFLLIPASAQADTDSEETLHA